MGAAPCRMDRDSGHRTPLSRRPLAALRRVRSLLRTAERHLAEPPVPPLRRGRHAVVARGYVGGIPLWERIQGAREMAACRNHGFRHGVPAALLCGGDDGGSVARPPGPFRTRVRLGCAEHSGRRQPGDLPRSHRVSLHGTACRGRPRGDGACETTGRRGGAPVRHLAVRCARGHRYILIGPDDFEWDLTPAQRRELCRSLEREPGVRVVYSADEIGIFEVAAHAGG